MSLSFRLWLNENSKTMGWKGALKGLLKSTCGDKSCSRGSTPWWALNSDEEAFKTPNLLPLKVNLGPGTKTAYNPDKSILIISVDNISPENKLNPKEIVENLTKKIYINQSQLLSLINDHFKKQQPSNLEDTMEKKYNKIDYSRYYLSKNSYIIEYKVV